MLCAVALALAPVVALSTTPASAITGLMVLGMLPTLTAAAAGTRALLAAGGASVVVAFVATLTTSSGPLLPLIGTALVVALAFATGALSPHGLHPVGAATIAFAAYVLVDPSRVLHTLGAHLSPLLAAAVLAGLVLAAVGWVCAVAATLLRGVTLPSTAVPTTLPYGLLLAALCGAFALVCLVWFRGTNSWWSVMTIAMILQPTRADTASKIHGRMAGTVLGGTAAAVLAVLVPAEAATTLLGLAATLLSVPLLLAGAAYWKYTTAATMSVILLTFDRSTLLVGDVQRILITLVAAAVTAAAVWAASRVASAGASRTDGAAVPYPFLSGSCTYRRGKCSAARSPCTIVQMTCKDVQ